MDEAARQASVVDSGVQYALYGAQLFKMPPSPFISWAADVEKLLSLKAKSAGGLARQHHEKILGNPIPTKASNFIGQRLDVTLTS